MSTEEYPLRDWLGESYCVTRVGSSTVAFVFQEKKRIRLTVSRFWCNTKRAFVFLGVPMSSTVKFPELARLNHIAVLVRDLGKAVEKFQSLGGKVLESEHLPESGADVAVLEVGGAHLEFLSTRQPESKVGKLLDRQGEGIHHLSFQVPDLEGALAEAKQAGIRLRDEVPRPGLHGRRIAFLDPADTCGILIELVEEKEFKH